MKVVFINNCFPDYHNKVDKLEVDFVRFQDGSGKLVVPAVLEPLTVICDVNDRSPNRYTGKRLSPDDHIRDIYRLQRIVGKSLLDTLIVPFQPYGRQHRPANGESAEAFDFIEEMYNLGFKRIVTYDSHDGEGTSKVANGRSFDNLVTYPQLMVCIPKSDIIVAPDSGAYKRQQLVFKDKPQGYFEKKRADYVVDGLNPIQSRVYHGEVVKEKSCVILDDMIASGGTVIEAAKILKSMGASKVYLAATFGLFTKGPSPFDTIYNEGILDGVYCTNLTYDSIGKQPWYSKVEFDITQMV